MEEYQNKIREIIFRLTVVLSLKLGRPTFLFGVGSADLG